jgi:hypothetical protein
MTLEAWVNPTAVTSAWRDVIYKGNDNYYLMATTDHSSFPGAGGTFGNVNANAYGTATLPLNTWTHLATSYDGSNIRLYVNERQLLGPVLQGNTRRRPRLQHSAFGCRDSIRYGDSGRRLRP